ncbi:MAG: flagellar biosynthesis anti-sigma factor FlgM [Legionellaceae bacterium]|nr:flagellar biosynthesis anti-sigma factor FlgM [Legionellaceae bacterium]
MTKQNINPSDSIEHVDFTDRSKQMATLMASILHESEPNHVKIQIIQEEIESGRYQINAQHIASKLLEFAPIQEEVMAV